MARKTSHDEQAQQVATALVAAAHQLRGATPPASLPKAVRQRPTPLAQQELRDRHGRVRDARKLTLGEGLRSLAYRNRRQLYPWWAMLGVLTAGYLAAFLTWTTGSDNLIGLATFAVTGAGVVTLAVIVVRRRVHAYWAAWLASAAMLAAGWVTATAFIGADYTGFVVLATATALLGLRWWKHVRHPLPDGPEDADRGGDPATEGARLVEDWVTKAACPGGPAAGASLVRLEPYEHGFTGAVQLVRGRQSLGDVQSALARLSTALDVAPENLIFEAHPDGPPSRLRMQVVTRSPVKRTVFFDQPGYRDGRILLGPYADGVGDATFVLYTDDSMESGYVLGSKGSGKSRIIETIALTAMWATPTVVFYLDGQNGASSPLLWEHALWRGGPKEAGEILRAALSIMEFRQLYNRKHKLTGFTPSDDLLGILIIVDECHKIFTEQSSPKWADVAREGRKLGVGVLAASQVTTLDAFGGGAQADALRSSLVSSNGIALRTASAVQSQVFPGLKVDLMALPRIPGFGYTVDDGDDQHRTAPFRARFLIDDKKSRERDEPLPDGVYTAEEWFATVSGRQQLDERSTRAAGPAYAQRHERAEHEQAELDAMFQHGKYAMRDSDLMAEDSAARGRAAAIPFPRLDALPHWNAGPQTEEPIADQVAPDGLTDAQYAVWDTIARGVRNTSEIATTLGISQRRVQIVVGELVAAGEVVKARRGEYALVASEGARV